MYNDPCSFFRGKGPLKNTSDVISAAKKIAEAGSRMDKLGRTIADHVSSRPNMWVSGSPAWSIPEAAITIIFRGHNTHLKNS